MAELPPVWRQPIGHTRSTVEASGCWPGPPGERAAGPGRAGRALSRRRPVLSCTRPSCCPSCGRAVPLGGRVAGRRAAAAGAARSRAVALDCGRRGGLVVVELPPLVLHAAELLHPLQRAGAGLVVAELLSLAELSPCGGSRAGAPGRRCRRRAAPSRTAAPGRADAAAAPGRRCRARSRPAPAWWWSSCCRRGGRPGRGDRAAGRAGVELLLLALHHVDGAGLAELPGLASAGRWWWCARSRPSCCPRCGRCGLGGGRAAERGQVGALQAPACGRHGRRRAEPGRAAACLSSCFRWCCAWSAVAASSCWP